MKLSAEDRERTPSDPIEMTIAALTASRRKKRRARRFGGAQSEETPSLHPLRRTGDDDHHDLERRLRGD